MLVPAATGLILGTAAAIGPGVGEPTAMATRGLLAVVLAAAAVALARSRPVAALVLAAAGLGAARGLHAGLHHPEDLTARLPASPMVLRVAGVRGGPDAVAAGGPSRWTLHVDAVLDAEGRRHPARGRLRVRTTEDPGGRPGDRVRLTGWYEPPEPPAWPGGFDGRTWARIRGDAGSLRVPAGAIASDGVAGGPGWAIRRLRAVVRDRGRAAIDRVLPEWGGPRMRAERTALVRALLMGVREPELRDVAEDFRRSGLAHVLAISGMHVGIVLGACLAALVRGWGWRRLHGAWLLAVVGGFLLLVDLRPPVLRAAIVSAGAAAGILARGRRPAIAWLAVAAIAIVLARPAWMLDPGFQLSFGVVLALMLAATGMRTRLFGRRPDRLDRWRAVWWHRTADAAAAGVVAWIASLPVGLHLFGMNATWAVPLGLVAVPMAAVILIGGYLAVLLAELSPPLGMLLGGPLAVVVDALILMVRAAAALPLATMECPRPPAVWGWGG